MADDWLDRWLGGVCKDTQKQIKENPFLTPPQKDQFIEMLQECADKARTDNEDTVVVMRQEMRVFANKFRLAAGRDLRMV